MKTFLLPFLGSFCLLISTLVDAQMHSTDFNGEVSDLVKKAQTRLDAVDVAPKANKQNPGWSNNDLNMGFILALRQQYQEAIPKYIAGFKRALTEGKSAQDPAFIPHYATVATCFLNIGNLSAAEFYLNKCLQLEAFLNETNWQVYALVRGNLATLHFYRGQTDLAMQFLQDARQSLQGRRQDLGYFTMLFNLATIYGENNQLELAEYLFDQCAAVLDSLNMTSGRERIALLNGRSNIQSRGEKHTESIQNSREALRLGAKDTVFATSLDFTRMCAGHGLSLLSLNEADSALQYLFLAEKGYEKLNLKPQEYPRLMEGLAMAYDLKNDSEKAEQYFKSGIQPLGISNEHSLSIRSNYSFFLLKNGRTKWAAIQLQEMLQAMSEILGRNTSTLSEQGKVHFAGHLNQFLNTPLSFALDFGQQYPEFVRAVGDAVLQLRGASLRNSRASYAAIRASGDTVLLGKYEHWKEIREVLNFQFQEPKTARTLNPALLDSLRLEVDLLETQLMANSADYRKERQKIDGSMIQTVLEAGEAAIQFIRFQYVTAGRLTDSVYYVANLYRKQNGSSEFIFLCNETDLKRRLGRGNTGSPEERIAKIYSPETKKFGEITIPSLYDLIWGKLEPHLAGVQKIWISPDGLLNQVAFEAIRQSLNLPEVGKLRKIQYLVSVGNLLDQNECFAREIKTAALFGNIQYKTDFAQMQAHLPGNSLASKNTCAGEIELRLADSNFENIASTNTFPPPSGIRNAVQPLPYTKQEIEQANNILKQHFATICAYQNYDALEEYFKALGYGNISPGIIHIATHGEYLVDAPNTASPLDKAVLLFAGSDSLWCCEKRIPGMEDQVLHASEVAVQNLSNTKLVILSACKSGLGDLHSSEGVFGFQRAFRLAGADHLVISLWAVSDMHTAAFFEAFYRNWFSGLEIRKAFNKTQAEMQAKYPAVFHWGAFVLY